MKIKCEAARNEHSPGDTPKGRASLPSPQRILSDMQIIFFLQRNLNSFMYAYFFSSFVMQQWIICPLTYLFPGYPHTQTHRNRFDSICHQTSSFSLLIFSRLQDFFFCQTGECFSGMFKYLKRINWLIACVTDFETSWARLVSVGAWLSKKFFLGNSWVENMYYLCYVNNLHKNDVNK